MTIPVSHDNSLDYERIAQELRRARRQMKLRQEDVAAHLNIARTTVTAIENGDRPVRDGELIALARLYKRSVSDFVRPRPTLDFTRTIQFRGPAQQTDAEADEIAVAITQMEDLCRNYLELESLVGEALPRTYPPVYMRAGHTLTEDAEKLAQIERERLGLGSGPLPALRDLLEQDVGIRIFYFPLKVSRFSAMYYYDEQVGACIVINSDHPEERCRWSLAHDYCHFLADRYSPAIGMMDGYKRMPESERFADAFAEEFLLPREDVTKRIQSIKQQRSLQVRDFLILANRYGVSLQAFVLRLETLSLIKPGRWVQIASSGFEIRSAQRELGLQEVSGRRDVFPLHYRHLVLSAQKQGLISEGVAAQFLHLDRLAVRELLHTEGQGGLPMEDTGAVAEKDTLPDE